MAEPDRRGQVGGGGPVHAQLGCRTVAVDTSGIENSPVGSSVDVVDRLSVSGGMDDADLFDRREVEASSVVILTNNRV
ncbi:hypothetical protein P7L78_21710 [Tistrella bauzanensis]|jgi:hypothetical protein|uniref:Uncharacterized protein n=1 Tax=Tistrella arctica TaxID=3133430 RepID=A0ABU9YS28_9PROT